MPGYPHHALGSPWLTVLVTTALSLAVVWGLFSVRRRFTDSRKYAAIGGVVYAAVYMSLWVVFPAVFWRFAVTMDDIGFVATVLVVAAVVTSLQAAIPIYLYADRGLKTPFVGMFVVSWVCGYLFLRVGGESGSTFVLFLWSTVIAPVGVLGVFFLGAVETGFQRVTNRNTG